MTPTECIVYPGSSANTGMPIVVVTEQRLPPEQQIEMNASDQIERNNRQLEQNLQSLVKDLQVNQPQFETAPTPFQQALSYAL